MDENPGKGRLATNTSADDDLTPRQRLFALEYLKDLNGKQAAIRAGYSAHSAEVTASKLLRVPKVAAFVKNRAEKVAGKVEIDAAYVLRGLKNVAERCQSEDPEWFDAAGANRALELLGKHLALFTEKQEVSGPNGGALEVVIRDLSKETEPQEE